MAGISLRVGTLDIGDDHPVRLMGVINVSPESFYTASVAGPGAVARRAREMLATGAALLDVGGRSTAPRSPKIAVEEESRRVREALGALFDGCDTGDTPISVDTQFRTVAEGAYASFRSAGREDQFVLNDVCCLRADPALAPWAAEVGCPVILMAAHERPGDSLGVTETLADLRRGVDLLDHLGVEVTRKVIVDPAIGRWISEKTALYDLEIIRDLVAFRDLGLPILVGISRKSFIGEVLGERDPAARLAGTQAATAVAVAFGAHVVRTHDVCRETVDTVRVAWSIRTGLVPGA